MPLARGAVAARELRRRRDLNIWGIAPEQSSWEGCEYLLSCRKRQLACRAFAQYVRTVHWKALTTLRLLSRRPQCTHSATDETMRRWLERVGSAGSRTLRFAWAR